VEIFSKLWSNCIVLHDTTSTKANIFLKFLFGRARQLRRSVRLYAYTPRLWGYHSFIVKNGQILIRPYSLWGIASILHASASKNGSSGSIIF
jgi:hypothetical protein